MGRYHCTIVQHHPCVICINYLGIQKYLNAHTAQLLQGVHPKLLGHGCQQAVGGLNQHHPGGMDAQFWIVFGQYIGNQLNQGSGKLHSGWPATHNHKGHQGPFAGRVRFYHRLFKAVQDLVAQYLCILKFL